MELAVSRLVRGPSRPSRREGDQPHKTLPAEDTIYNNKTPQSEPLNSTLPSGRFGWATIWGISATIGNLEEAKEVLLAPSNSPQGGEPKPHQLRSAGVIVKADLQKQIEMESIFPDEIEKYPWAGHLGIKLAHKVIPIIQQSKTTLIFINTRGMSETWYQTLLNVCPELAGSIALHHGSIDRNSDHG